MAVLLNTEKERRRLTDLAKQAMMKTSSSTIIRSYHKMMTSHYVNQEVVCIVIVGLNVSPKVPLLPLSLLSLGPGGLTRYFR